MVCLTTRLSLLLTDLARTWEGATPVSIRGVHVGPNTICLRREEVQEYYNQELHLCIVLDSWRNANQTTVFAKS